MKKTILSMWFATFWNSNWKYAYLANSASIEQAATFQVITSYSQNIANIKASSLMVVKS